MVIGLPPTTTAPVCGPDSSVSAVPVVAVAVVDFAPSYMSHHSSSIFFSPTTTPSLASFEFVTSDRFAASLAMPSEPPPPATPPPRKKKQQRINFAKKPKRGRPPKSLALTPLQSPKRIRSNDRKGAVVTASQPTKRGKRGSYKNYKTDPASAAALQAIVSARLKGEEDPVPQLEKGPIISIPPATIRRAVKAAQLAQIAADKAIDPLDDSSEILFAEPSPGSSLTTPQQRLFLARTARARDENNNGMSRHEMINVVMQLTDGTALQAKNHYDFLIRSKALPELKRWGRVVSAQKTTTKRSAIRVEGQLRWHTLVEETWEEHARLNLPALDFMKLRSYFTLNLDETGVQMNDGKVQVIGSSSRKKHEKNMDDARDSITIIRIGSSAGKSGPWIFLLKGKKKLERRSLMDLPRDYGAPPGSFVIMTPNAYLNDETWIEIAPRLAKGIRSMEVIEQHPDWWVLMSLDGYGSHLQPKALVVFAEHNIEVLKEEGDTSHVNQAYDQSVAKTDKRLIREKNDMLKSARTGNNKVVDQYDTVGCCISALLDYPEKDWINSFIKVNMHPDHRVSFKLWLERIEESVKTGEKYFKGRLTLYDAMPAVWKGLSEKLRRIICTRIDRFYEDARTNLNDPNENPWNKENILSLVQHIPLDEVAHIRSSYLAAKIDPLVFKTETRVVVATDAPTTIDAYPEFSWRPVNMVAEYVESKFTVLDKKYTISTADSIDNFHLSRSSNLEPVNKRQRLSYETRERPKSGRSITSQYFDHIANFVCRTHNHESGLPLRPQDWVNIEITKQQQRLLQPLPYDVLIGSLMEETMGERAKKKVAKRRLDAISGNVAAYCRSLNNPGQLEKVKEAAGVASIVGAIRADYDAEKEDRSKKKKKETKEKKARRKKKEAELKKKKRELLPEQQEHLSKGMVHLKTLNNTILKGILRYRFDVPGTAQMDKGKLLSGIEEKLASVTGATAEEEEDPSDSESEQSKRSNASSSSDEEEGPQEGL
jgi:hypothetical protein